MARDILTRYRRSPAFTEEVIWLVENHMRFHFFANSPEVFSEFVLEFKQSVLEIGHVDALASCDFKLLAEREGLL